MIFYLGTHEPSWLKWLDLPLFVSRRRLERRILLPRALGPWALDSGGFTELSLSGGWTIDEATYVERVNRYAEEVGNLRWAAPQDWMCEPDMLRKTGLTVEEHQRRTLDNYLRLRALDARVPIIPVLQGWESDDYLRHRDAFEGAGVRLEDEPLVGVGTVCRRQHTDEASELLTRLAAEGLALHGFGVKTLGLARVASQLASADSMAWSLNARKHPPLRGCSHRTCANCERWALRWRGKLLASLADGGSRQQQGLPGPGGRGPRTRKECEAMENPKGVRSNGCH